MFGKKKYDPAAEAARRRTISLPPDGYEDRGPVRLAVPTDHLPPVGSERASGDRFEYKQVEVPTGHGNKERVLNRYARDGWRLAEIRSGGLLFGTKDVAILVRERP